MPDEVRDLKDDTQIRLVRGYAGTGKTDVLVLRVHHLYDTYPELSLLVTTFNRGVFERRLSPELKSLQDRVKVATFDSLCTAVYQKKHQKWNEPQSTLGLVAKMEKEHHIIKDFGVKFLADEFSWMKEIGRTKRDDYVKGIREGRGGGPDGRSLTRAMKEQVFDLFEVYEAELRDLLAYDWVDLHDRTFRYLEQGIQPDQLFDTVLIDEAQHFAPLWMKIIYKFLKPGGHLFLCDDPSQSVYRYYSWSQKHVEVRGRTKWLRIPYRNTRQIFEAAYSLIMDDKSAQKLLSESGAAQPDLSNSAIRDGIRPEIREFGNFEQEHKFVVTEIQQLVQSGVLPEEIAVLHTKKHIVKRYQQSLTHIGIQVLQAREQTGTEFSVVFIPRVQELPDATSGIGWQDAQSRERFQFYMLITRARDRSYLLYSQKWPKEFESILPYCATFPKTL